MEHRVFRRINEFLDKGERVFFVYGRSKYVNDLFYVRSNKEGKLLSLRQSMVEAFKGLNMVRKVLQIYYEDGKIHLESTKELGREVSIKDDLGEFSTLSKRSVHEVYNDNTALINAIKDLNLRELKYGGWLVIFDDFNRIANVYRGFDSSEVARFFNEVILDWKKLDNNYYIFILRDKELGHLEDFGISAQEAIEVLDPNVHELAKALVLKAKKYKKIIEFPLTYASKFVEQQKPLKMIVSEFEKIVSETEGDRITIEIKDISLDDVKLKKEIREKIRNLFEKFKEGKTVVNGIILYGPPGTGKTTVARALANEAGAYFLKTSASDFKGEYLGQSGQNTRRIFERLRNNKPAILFIDEADAILAHRSGSDTYSTEIVNEFLANVDGLKADREIFVVIATNYLERLDDAVRSRFEEIKIDIPEGEVLREIVKEYLGKDFEDNYGMFYGLSGRDISLLGKQWREGIIRSKEELLNKVKRERLSGLNPREPRWDFSAVWGYSSQKEAVRRLFDTGIRKIAVLGNIKSGKSFFIEAIAGEFGLTIITRLPDNPARLHGIEDKVLLWVENNLPANIDDFPNVAVATEINSMNEEVKNLALNLGFIDVELETDEETISEFAKRKFNLEIDERDLKELIGKGFPYIDNYLKFRRVAQ